jgi:hypothetical protein
VPEQRSGGSAEQDLGLATAAAAASEQPAERDIIMRCVYSLMRSEAPPTAESLAAQASASVPEIEQRVAAITHSIRAWHAQFKAANGAAAPKHADMKGDEAFAALLAALKAAQLELRRAQHAARSSNSA